MPSAARQRDPDVSLVYEDDVEELVHKLQEAASVRNSLPKGEITDVVEKISRHASARGLATEPLEILIDLLTTAPCYLDQLTVGNIIKILLPRRKVSEDVVVKVVGCLGQGQSKPPLGTQTLLLRWLVMVYNVLEDYTVISQLYGVLFNMLEMISLRSHLCHLLSILTRRKHVKPFRIQALLELKRNVGNEQALLGILQVYKDYYPDVIVGEIAPTKSGLFSHPSPEWMQKLLAIQESNSADHPDIPEKSSFRVVRKVRGQGSKRRKTGHLTLPQVHTFLAVEASVTLEEVENVDDFVAKLDKLELPNQLVAVLEDPLLQKLLALRPSVSGDTRINNWLRACFADELHSSKTAAPGMSGRTAELLSRILQYTRSSRQLLPAVEEFLRNYLCTWDGKAHNESILGLLCFLPLREFGELHTAFFKPLDNTLKSGSDVSAARLLDFYTRLLYQWTVVYRSRTPDSEMLDEEALTLRKFTKHVGQICLVTLANFTGSCVVAETILAYLECASSLPWENSLFHIVLPPDTLVYRFVFAGNAMILSRICGILCRYKHGFEVSKKRAPPELEGEYPRESVDHFNGFMMDICNCLWRNRAFSWGGPESKIDRNALGCTLPEEVTGLLKTVADARDETLSTLFSLSHSAILAQFSADYLRAIEDVAPGLNLRHAGPVTQRSLKLLATDGGLNMSYMDFRVAVLNDLGRKGFKGIFDFMHSTMISLIKPKPSAATVSSSTITGARDSSSAT